MTQVREATSYTISFSCEIPNPIAWVSDKVRECAEAFFGFIVRVVVFQLGEMQKGGAHFVMRAWQMLSCDPRDQAVDLERLQKSKELLIHYGGKEFTLEPADKQAQIKCMFFKSDDFKARLGGREIKTREGGRVLIDVNLEHAKKFGLPLDKITRTDQTIVEGIFLPESAEFNAMGTPLILHSHSPGRSMCMDRRFIAWHLISGYDVAVWDPRGTIESTGTPSEGGYYLDAEAVYQKARELHYEPHRIYVSGYCEGAAMAAHLKKKYHRDGVNFIASNTFTSMKEVIENHSWLGRIAAHYGLEALKDSNLDVAQDGFNNLEKIQSLQPGIGKSVIIHTIPDKWMPWRSSEKLLSALNKTDRVVHEITTHMQDAETCGHTRPPLEDEEVWRRYVKVVN
jgi:hypothetical protein